MSLAMALFVHSPLQKIKFTCTLYITKKNSKPLLSDRYFYRINMV